MSRDPGSRGGADSLADAADETPRWSPYPGLRPFQLDDAEYFYGRDAEADEIVARLRATRFVAVIGGSGSGKSSLVLAGAIPRLRSFAIKEAGDFWVPIVSTPGTNHGTGDGPLRRLAHKFCAQLIDVARPADQLELCVAMLRRPNGLGALVTRFGSRLKGAGDVSLPNLQVNFLFLLDQFEELFHPSNAAEPIAGECRALVARIVEQFKTPHPQVCVALTMRSEHLNDCPRFEALPDAINGASYLVKRLGIAELRQAIEQPALRYLRKHVAELRQARRQARLDGRPPPAAAAPDNIAIEPALIERLLADSIRVMAQQDHADHLPLLQHLLFWIWHRASARCAGQPLVDALTLQDLGAAVGDPAAAPGAPIAPLDPAVNTLEACLENCCEAVFASDCARQAPWEAAFRSLAFKEPNSGTYTQQRASMVELAERLGVTPGDHAALATNLAPWLRPHGYLHWDLDSRTVKVAHETLIRRWLRLRRWIDEEDRQFHVCLRLLDDCARWQAAGRPAWALATGDTLRRYQDEQLPQLLSDPAWRVRLDRLLQIDREGARLAVLADGAARYLELSIQSGLEAERELAQLDKERSEAARELEAAQRDADMQRAKNAEYEARAEAASEKTRRIAYRSLLQFSVIALLVPLALWAAAIARTEHVLSEKERMLHRSYALAAQSQAGFAPQFQDLDGPQALLRYALFGARFFEAGRALPNGWVRWPPLEQYYADRLDSLRNTERFSEAGNTTSLRTIVQGGVWRVPPTENATVSDGRHCSIASRNAFFVPRPTSTRGRGLILDVGAGAGGSSTVSVGRVDDGGGCIVEQQILSTPPQPRPVRVGIDHDASNIVLALAGYTQFYAVVWSGPNDVSTRPRAVAAVELDDTFGNGELPTARRRFWTDLRLGPAITVRLHDSEPSIADAAMLGSGRALQPMQADDGAAACRAFAKAHEIDLRTSGLFELRPPTGRAAGGFSYCLLTTTGLSAQQTTSYFASLYRLGASAADGEKDRDLPLISQLPLGSRMPDRFLLDETGGWLAFSRDNGSWRALPWSLAAFRAMASAVFVALPPGAPASANGAGVDGIPGCGRPGGDPQFDLPYNLILGDIACPSDEQLKTPAPEGVAQAAPARVPALAGAGSAIPVTVSLPAPAGSRARTPPASSPPPR